MGRGHEVITLETSGCGVRGPGIVSGVGDFIRGVIVTDVERVPISCRGGSFGDYGPILAQCQRRWPSIDPQLGLCGVAGLHDTAQDHQMGYCLSVPPVSKRFMAAVMAQISTRTLSSSLWHAECGETTRFFSVGKMITPGMFFAGELTNQWKNGSTLLELMLVSNPLWLDEISFLHYARSLDFPSDHNSPLVILFSNLEQKLWRWTMINHPNWPCTIHSIAGQ